MNVSPESPSFGVSPDLPARRSRARVWFLGIVWLAPTLTVAVCTAGAIVSGEFAERWPGYLILVVLAVVLSLALTAAYSIVNRHAR